MPLAKIVTLVCLPTCLLLLAIVAKESLAGGIDFDLNEPPPEEYLQDEAYEDTQLQLEAERAKQNVICPMPKASFSGRGGEKLKQEMRSAATFGERFRQLMQAQAQANAAKEVPDYCNYENFKSMHEALKGQKSTDTAERTFRHLLYLKRCLAVLRSRIEYRLGKKTYLEGVTPLADLSPNEVGQLFMSAPPVEFKQQQKSEVQYKAELREQRLALKENDLELASQATLEEEEEEDNNNNNNNKKQELARMAEKLDHGDSLPVMDANFVKTMVASMLERLQANLKDFDQEEYRLAVREELIGAQIVLKSEACANFDDSGRLLAPYPTDRWPLSDKRPPGRASGTLPEPQAQASYQVPQLKGWRRQYLDWSHHKCFHRIYKQFSQCGCCYVVAAVNLAEFVSCTEQENSIAQRRFSEMHVLNCGSKYSPYNMGCSGGSVLETLRFIGRAGAYTRKAWRERLGESAKRKEFMDARDINCPMMLGLPWDEWGREKVLLNPVVVHANEWLEALEDGPLVATVQMPRDGITTYSSGVHDGASCNGSGIWHVMVLVGYGIDERGIAYWRFRNSFGPEWGDQGHFNLAMSVPGECFAGGVRVYREPVDL